MNTLMKLNCSISEHLKESISLFEPFKYVYLFGSAVNPNLVYNDIDILIIYSEYSSEIENALRVVSDELEKAIGLLVDLTALSIEEERGTAFIEKIKPNYLKIK